MWHFEYQVPVPLVWLVRALSEQDAREGLCSGRAPRDGGGAAHPLRATGNCRQGQGYRVVRVLLVDLGSLSLYRHPPVYQSVRPPRPRVVFFACLGYCSDAL